MAAKFEIRSPTAGEFSWVLVSQGRTLAIGETYGRKVSCANAIESLRKAAATATVDDTTPTRGQTKAGTTNTAGTAGKKVAVRAAKTAAKSVAKTAATAAVGGVATDLAAGAAKTGVKAAGKTAKLTATVVAKTAKVAGKAAAGAAKKAAPRKRASRHS